MATDVSPKAPVGSILGGLNTMQPIGMILFLQLGGYLYDVLGPGWAFGLQGGADILLGIWLIISSNKINQCGIGIRGQSRRCYDLGKHPI